MTGIEEEQMWKQSEEEYYRTRTEEPLTWLGVLAWTGGGVVLGFILVYLLLIS